MSNQHISIMSKIPNERASGIGSWQSDRMRSLLAERWPYVWQVVETRAKNSSELLSAQGCFNTKGEAI